MADEAAIQEIITEIASAEPVTETVVESGGAVQATDTDATTPESSTEEKPGKTYDESYVRKLREENAATRVKAKDAEKAAQEAAARAQETADAQKSLTEKLGRALGFVQDDEPLAPEDLLKQAAERESKLATERDAVAEKLRTYQRRDAITRAATAPGVDGDLEQILDSKKIESEIKKLDTTADDYDAQVAEIVTAHVESNPKLKKTVAQVAAPRSGGDLSGGNGAPKPTGDKSIDDLIRERREKRARDLKS